MVPRKSDKEKYETGYSPIGLVSYPNLITPGTGKFDKDKYGVGLFVHIDDLKADQAKPDSFVLKLLKVARAYTGNEALKLNDPTFRFPLKKVTTWDAEKIAKLPDVLKESIDSWWYMKTAGKFKPNVVGPDGKNKWTDPQIESGVKAGGRARVAVTFAPYMLELDKSKGVSLWLNGVQYIQDKYEFRGGISFEEISVEAAPMAASGDAMFG